MLNRVSALSLVLGVIAGYAVRGTDVTAQAAPQGVPLALGDKVTLVYQQIMKDQSAQQTQCTVMALRGNFVRCTPAGNSNFRDSEGERWINLGFAVEIVKH
jgi:hypothetical protein